MLMGRRPSLWISVCCCCCWPGSLVPSYLLLKEILSSFSCKLSKLFNNPSANSSAKALKVIFHDFPGGPEGFELFARFCYKNGDLQITPSNTPLLHCIAHFMEMSKATLSSSPCLINSTRKSLEMIQFWTWSDTVNSLKQCQELSAISGSSAVLNKILDSLLARIAAISDASPSDSPESSALRFSCDTRSTVSVKTGNSRSWWFEDLVLLDPRMIEKVIKGMLSRKIEHGTISRFLFYYLKSRLSNAALYEKKKKATEVTIELLNCLDVNSVSCKRLFGILRVSSSLKISRACRSTLEAMIGAQIDQASLDNLLIPSSTLIDSIYDVNLILRFLKSFLDIVGKELVARLKRVGRLMDLYLAEVAPDSCLKPAKFVALIASLPDAARDCHDAIYRAIDMYLEVHSQLSDEEKMKICCCINYEKLSSECCKHLAKNAKFPSRITIQALVSQHSKLRSLLQDTNNIKSTQKSPLKGKQCEDGEQIILYAKKLDLSIENEKLKAHLQGMHWRVMELEKVCKKMQTQMTSIMKSRKHPATGGSRSLPRLCS
ncbi:BTB/POZ domain-containing protein At3g22104-like isoform X1 [Ananas comosus]|uniref:BTB/POZ domain-containing protein At3g22104-like isoform X1 n=1 Tax=Ananas comosus TaxID=4615 RepID=A0A6P5EQW3_ANACO|nr:BTB/POZ domain-containing protein At3g22104-like isoform X1 [Ananas comosus]